MGNYESQCDIAIYSGKPGLIPHSYIRSLLDILDQSQFSQSPFSPSFTWFLQLVQENNVIASWKQFSICVFSPDVCSSSMPMTPLLPTIVMSGSMLHPKQLGGVNICREAFLAMFPQFGTYTI